MRAAAHAAMKLILIYCNNTACLEARWRKVRHSRISDEAPIRVHLYQRNGHVSGRRHIRNIKLKVSLK